MTGRVTREIEVMWLAPSGGVSPITFYLVRRDFKPQSPPHRVLVESVSLVLVIIDCNSLIYRLYKTLSC
jgi:hypothetical protein